MPGALPFTQIGTVYNICLIDQTSSLRASMGCNTFPVLGNIIVFCFVYFCILSVPNFATLITVVLLTTFKAPFKPISPSWFPVNSTAGLAVILSCIFIQGPRVSETSCSYRLTGPLAQCPQRVGTQSELVQSESEPSGLFLPTSCGKQHDNSSFGRIWPQTVEMGYWPSLLHKHPSGRTWCGTSRRRTRLVHSVLSVPPLPFVRHATVERCALLSKNSELFPRDKTARWSNVGFHNQPRKAHGGRWNWTRLRNNMT